MQRSRRANISRWNTTNEILAEMRRLENEVNTTMNELEQDIEVRTTL